MGLSKDNTDDIDEIKISELTTAQKRRQRRKKLKAAKDAKLIDNLKSDTAILFQDIISTCQDTVLKNSTPKDTKNQKTKNDDQHLTSNQNKSENHLLHKEPESKNSVINVNQKSKLNEEYQVQTENLSVIVNKKKKIGKQQIVKNQASANLNFNENQAVVAQSLLGNENQSLKLKDQSKIKADIPCGKEPVLTKEQIIDSTTSETHNKKSVSSKKENYKPKPEKKESIENVTSNLNNQNMGKVSDAPESKKQQEVLTKLESKKHDTVSTAESDKSRDEIKAAREAKKLAKQKAKKKDETAGPNVEEKSIPPKTNTQATLVKNNVAKNQKASINKTEKSKRGEPITDLKPKENILPTDKAKATDKIIKVPDEKSKGDVKSETTAAKPEEASKSKAELKAERRAKQEAQRAAKLAAEQKAAAPEVKDKEPAMSKEEKSPKAKTVEKSKSKTQSAQRVGWFQHTCMQRDKEPLDRIPINSNIHPAVVKLGVQLASHAISGSNARCIALLDAIKKMVRDYSLPARTEFGRGLQTQLDTAAAFLWARRAPSASAAETNALKHFRRQLTLLPANVDEFDAKKQLQEDIDRYIREQIDMAGEAISLTLSQKISPGDNILTYGCSSLIERVLCSAWESGVRFHTTVAGARGQRGTEMLRRLRARGVPATYVDISSLSYIMVNVQKVLLGAGALLAHGAALGAAGSAQVALVARARNVPVLVACETHKFSERTHVDPLVCQEIGDPDELVDKTDENSPLKDWRANSNLTLLNVTYDVTPPSLITAVVTELGILPCTSAPVVLRFKQSEYGM